MSLDLDAIRQDIEDADGTWHMDGDDTASMDAALRVLGTHAPDLLAEVERLRANQLPNLCDGDGTVWVYAGQAYRVDSDDRNAPTLVLRTEIEADWGPVTEVAS